jgi:hypothetical protein
VREIRPRASPIEMARLYSAYVQDTLSFLAYAQLQECRLMPSRSVNANIVDNPIETSATESSRQEFIETLRTQIKQPKGQSSRYELKRLGCLACSSCLLLLVSAGLVPSR